jgi:hypothetical protein
MPPRRIVVALLCCTVCSGWLGVCEALAQSRRFEEVERFPAAEARQGVAVDAAHFYAIDNRTIAKYDKRTGRLVAKWTASDELPLVHLNGGVVVEGKLFCAHSNYPTLPETSSIEVWEAATLEHAASHRLGITEGSLTWIDRHDGTWWAVFAYYDKQSAERGTALTRLARLDDEWRELQSWAFPAEVIERFRPSSCSGGSFGADGLLYCTGHEHPELDVLRLPKAGRVLELLETLAVTNPGQGIAWDRGRAGMLYGVDRGKKEVVVLKLRSTSLSETDR